MSLKGVLKRTKTYEIGIAQMLAIKTTNNGRSIILEQYGLTSIEWFVLGMAYNETPAGGIRVTDLATMLEVKTTYITSVLRTLKDKGYAETRTDPNDARVRLVVATEKANQVINAIEDSLLDKIEHALSDRVTEDQMRSYIHVLQEITQIKVPTSHSQS